MVIVWGSRLYGKVDVVPGFFHVATRFGHVYYLPLIPLKSFVVLGQQGDQFHGVPIPLSAKSIFLAWIRALLLVTVICAGIAALVNLQDRDPTHWMYPTGIAVGALVLLIAACWHRVATRASVHRACALGQLVGLNEAGMAELYKVYGEAAGRGFEVAPAAAGRSFPSAVPRPTPVVPVAARAKPVSAEPLDPIPLEPMPGEQEEESASTSRRGQSEPELGLR